jgi:hypothetical protein
VVFGLGSFAAIFLIAIPFGFHPKVGTVAIFWGAAFAGAAWVAFNCWRKTRNGDFDLVLDRNAAVLSLPAMHGRKEREELLLSSISGIETREVFRTDKRGRPARQKSTDVLLITKDGREFLLNKPASLADGEQWAEAMRKRLGV